MEATLPQPMFDRTPAQPGVDQLVARNDAVLSPGKCPDIPRVPPA